MAAVDVAKNFVQRWNFIVQLRGLIKVDSLAFPGPNDVRIRPNPNISTSRCQITRSIALWSTGISKKESSIFNAMLTEIHKAETFIYIENQYFISIAGSKNLTDAQNNLKNIGDALVHRIQRAFNNQQPFKVVVVVPEYPEGDPGNDIFIQRVMYWYLFIFYSFFIFFIIILFLEFLILTKSTKGNIKLLNIYKNK